MLRANHDENTPSSVKSLRNNNEMYENEFNLLIWTEFYTINISREVFYIIVSKWDKQIHSICKIVEEYREQRTQ